MLTSYIISGIVTDLTFRIAWWMAKKVAYNSITTLTYAIVPYAIVPYAIVPYAKKLNL
jgi:uncharacterized membrane protein YccF (DUF307 family)